MRIKSLYFWVFILIGLFAFSGCYTQLRLEDDDYSYRKERKKVIIEKRVETDSEEVAEDTLYESTDGEAEYEEEIYYYPHHRRVYKYYHPGITIIVDGAVFYDPWYFDYFYYPYTICRTYYLPWWYGYYSCYRVWYGFAYYDPFYNPFYLPPYWWYDPYWYGGTYPPIVQYRKNDFTRLRNNDGGRSGSISTGNWGRDLNLQVANTRTRLRDIDIPSTRNTNERNVRVNEDGRYVRTPTQREPGVNQDRDIKTNTPETRRPKVESTKPRIEDRQPQTPKLPERKDVRERENKSPDQTPNKDRKREESPTRKFESFNPILDREININRKIDDQKNIRNNDQPSNRQDFYKSYRRDKIRIEYDLPRREYVPRHKVETRTKSESESDRKSNSVNRNRNSYTPQYEPRYESPRYEPPRYETPSRNNVPVYTPSTRTAPPPNIQSPSTDRRRDR